ncbi:MAG: hypothetical protein HKN29_06080 [Rhodothermales bacterium]|nr:hypothetical protein [Rhodothermales bacterium]
MLGSPRPGRSDRALPLGMVQMATERWLRISGPNTSALEGALNVRISIEAAFDPAAGYVHVMGIIPGSHPVERNRLVVLGANLDSGADPSGPTLLDPEASGIAAAGLLEAARVLALEEDQGRGQPHSILVAWWAGGAQGNAGLRGFLENPPWSERAIDQVYYAGRPFAGGRARIERLGADAVLASPAADPVRERGTELAAAYYQKARAAGG